MFNIRSLRLDLLNSYSNCLSHCESQGHIYICHGHILFNLEPEQISSYTEYCIITVLKNDDLTFFTV